MALGHCTRHDITTTNEMNPNLAGIIGLALCGAGIFLPFRASTPGPGGGLDLLPLGLAALCWIAAVMLFRYSFRARR
jgi:hypothetical protein